ncbi:MAG: phosphotransferase [Acidobacteriota bacterium]|nr:phosphotransferase [Acidobacteriota bacterium]
MNEPLISVVFTIRGGGDRIRTAWESLQGQTYRHWEAVAAAADLTSDARDALALLARDDSRFRLIHAPAAHDMPAARNAAVQDSRGEWVAFLDCNERFLPHSLAARLDIARSDALVVVHSDGYLTHGGQPTTIGVPALAGRVYRDLLGEPGPLFPGLLVAKGALAECGYLDPRLEHFQAWDLSIRLAQRHPFGFEGAPTFVTEHRGAGSSAAGRAETAEEYERVLWKHRLAMLRQGGPGLLRRHYRLAAETYDDAGQGTAAARCRAMAFVCGCADAARSLGEVPRLWSRRPRRPAHQRFVQLSHLEPAEISLRLTELLREPVRELSSEFSAGQSGNVHRVQFRGASDLPRTVVLKKVDSTFEYDFYRQILEPLGLDAPKAHGHVVTSSGRFLVMDYVPHETARWTDHDKFRTAARWLAKKDRVVHEHFQSILDTGLLKFARHRPPLQENIDDAIDIIGAGVERKVSPLLSPLMLQGLRERRQLLHGLAADIFTKSQLTICHRDFHLQNVLFPVDDRAPVHVIDWSNPEVDSVCVDLARLVLLAPPPIRGELIEIYRSQVDFDGFAERYQQAEVVMTLLQFAWSFSVILHARRGPLNAAELRKARTLQRRLVEHLRLGLD